MLKGECKIQLYMQISFISLTNEESDTIHSNSDNIEIMRGIDTNNVVNRLIESFKQRYQENPKNTKDNRCYLYAIVTLNFHKIPEITLKEYLILYHLYQIIIGIM